MIKIDHKCHYPFNPSSMVTILLFKKTGLKYIATDGEERCAWHFAEEIETTIHNSKIITDNYKKELLEEIKKVKLGRSRI
ncbi:MAG: hypothetical protein VX227_04695 [Nitrospinota bacterium]|nr:hypothetical protein [Nitrospinota bacterium]